MAARTRPHPLWIAVLIALTAVVAIVAVCTGPISVSPRETFEAIGRMLTGQAATGQDSIITAIRLPRVLVAALVGGALAVAGAAMQAVFRNPLAEPGITGVSAGAAVAAVALIVTGAGSNLPWLIPVGAFAGALLATALVQSIGLGRAGTSTGTLLLVGIALNAFLGAVIAALIANAPNSDDARSAYFWLNGDMTGVTMDDVTISVIPLIVGVVGVVIFSRELNMMALGEATAQSSGVAVRRVSHLVLAFAALATAAGVAVVGIISFVGLVVPHLVRLVAGPDHRFLLPASFFLGSVFLVTADTAARMLFDPVVLQTGTITALIGAPFLLVLVLRTRAR